MNPLLLPTIAFILGILAQGLELNEMLLLAPLLIAVALAFIGKQYYSLLCVAFILGSADAWLHHPKEVDSSLWGKPIVYSGIVKSAKHSDSSQRLILTVDSCGGEECRPFLVGVTLMNTMPIVDDGQRVKIKTSLQPPISRLDFPDDIDYAATLRDRGVRAMAVVRDSDWLSVTPLPGLMNDIRRYRDTVSNLISESPLSAPTMEFLNTVMVGENEMLKPEAREAFSTAGMAHILALSGLHVGIIAWLISLALWPLRIFYFRSARLIITIVLIWLFVIVTGMADSTVRSAVMVTIFLVGRLIRRDSMPLNSLCFAALVILLVNPEDLYHIGFQMTFLAVMAILLIAPKLNIFDEREHFSRFNTFQWVTVPIAAMLGTGLVGCYYFHIFPVYFLVSNIITAALLPVLLAGAVVLLLGTAFGFSLTWLGFCIDGIYDIIMLVATKVANLPGASINDVYISLPTVWVLLGAVALFTIWLHNKRYPILLSTLALLIIALGVERLYSERYPVHEGHILYEGASTGMLVRVNDKLWYYSTDPRIDRLSDVSSLDERAFEYRSKRKLQGITYAPKTINVPGFSRAGNVISSNGKRYAFISRDWQVHPYKHHLNRLVLCNGFKGDAVDAAEIANADTVLLSRDLNKRRHDRYMRELTAANIPFVSLRHGSLVVGE